MAIETAPPDGMENWRMPSACASMVAAMSTFDTRKRTVPGPQDPVRPEPGLPPQASEYQGSPGFVKGGIVGVDEQKLALFLVPTNRTSDTVHSTG